MFMHITSQEGYVYVHTDIIFYEIVISFVQLVAILPLAIVHTMGNLFTNMSLGKVAVSFTHTIKAMEPFFSVLLSALFLGEVNFSSKFYFIKSNR